MPFRTLASEREAKRLPTPMTSCRGLDLTSRVLQVLLGRTPIRERGLGSVRQRLGCLWLVEELVVLPS